MAIEIEDKFDVPADFAVPDFGGLAESGEAVDLVSHRLVALYFDTPDLRLAARGITLRRRRGGDDAGWTLKLPKAKGARTEITRPLTRGAKSVPPELAELVLAQTRGEPLVQVAELETLRKVTSLRDAGGRRLVEIADDHVKGTVFGEDRHVERWREVEAELIDGDEAVLKKVGKRLRKAGATPAESGNKLARLLGDRVPVTTPAALDPDSAGGVVVAYLASQVAALTAQDPQVRRAEEDAVHQMRVASRRLRSALKSFSSVITETEGVQDELRWIAGVLGEARDLEVIRERFAGHLDGLEPEVVVGPVRTRLGDDLAAREREAMVRIGAAMSGERYFALLDRLDAMIANPPLTPLAAGKADTVLGKIAGKTWNRVVKRYDAAQAIEDAERREIAMHDVRKAAKRARYTAEALRPLLGDTADDLAKRAKSVQTVLGLHQDGVVAQQILLEEAARAREAGEDTFTYGLLAGIERAAAERSHAEFPAVWAEVTAS
ncbi:CHAD domain-containing protein [Sphaerisporangium siamense]|uniref:CHAD domain-containing protein n=1 Tax=Sphaerisporangium siamense TaxID=795645 RepID=A0A7W7G8W3_9ACTN|nr:CYTH and CHAD domain-containing protein [Sphaerisporangium siamense]MBB4700717.1 CHAD domain-containing protein [Sphaerisporangium siamense]GII88766.1 CHAD domain-containing protein [Sphaerisporangium siamense]